MPPLERRGRADVADDGLEVGHGVLVGVGHAVGPHHRVVRDPDDAAGHGGRAADQLLLLEHDRSETSVDGRHSGYQPAAPAPDDDDVDGLVPRRHEFRPFAPARPGFRVACTASTIRSALGYTSDSRLRAAGLGTNRAPSRATGAASSPKSCS